jgi:secreted trypsin-like serine protease
MPTDSCAECHDSAPRLDGLWWTLRWLRRSAGVLLLAHAAAAHAILAGAPPDTPSVRVDPNTASSQWAGVGSLSVGSNTYSAVAIGAHYVLTAAHVVKGAAVASIRFNLNLGGDLTHQIPAAAVFVHPAYVAFNNPNLQHDIAIVELAQDLPASVPICGLYFADIAPGTRLTMVGYGASGQGSVGVTVGSSATVKRSGGNAADAFDLDVDGSGRKAIYRFDFDGGSAANYFGAGSLGNAVETTFAGGDSGSPAFVMTGSPRVAAVNTFVLSFQGGPTTAGVFGTGGGGNLVFAYREWIESVVDRPGTHHADIPLLPYWGLALMGMLLLMIGAGRLRR